METVIIHQKGEDFEITVQHDESGSAYGITLSKNAYEQLRQHFVGGRSEQCNHIFERVERGGECQGYQCDCGEWEDLT